MWRAKEKVIFEVQIPHGMKHFRATHDRYPKDYEEFDREILKPAQIKLPELPPGQKYHYDPEKGELQIEVPEEQGATPD